MREPPILMNGAMVREAGERRKNVEVPRADSA